MDKVLDLFPRLRARRRNFGQQLSGGEQQMLAIARALATNPSVLLLDEPVEGLAPLVVQELVAAIGRMRSDADLAILMVEQKFEIALTHSDRCLVMDRGEIVHRCRSRDLLHDHATLDRLIGVAR
jgi:branched-chain amino acid transport system ATP-binding protein